MVTIIEGKNGKILEHPTVDGGGMSAILLHDIKSVSWKKLEIQKRKPNGEPIGKPKKSINLIFTAGKGQYGIECDSVREAEKIYKLIKGLM